MVKLSLYKHFTNTLIFAVLASVIFMLYSIKTRKFDPCFTEWKDLWIDEGFWHVLFSTLLLVIMILWRPTNNNQRYAFTPLLDNPEDEDEGKNKGLICKLGITSVFIELPFMFEVLCPRQTFTDYVSNKYTDFDMSVNPM